MVGCAFLFLDTRHTTVMVSKQQRTSTPPPAPVPTPARNRTLLGMAVSATVLVAREGNGVAITGVGDKETTVVEETMVMGGVAVMGKMCCEACL